MNLERKEYPNGHIVEEFYWNGKFVVYVDYVLSNRTFEEEIERLEKDNDNV